jgi:hypothetical protein
MQHDAAYEINPYPMVGAQVIDLLIPTRSPYILADKFNGV